MSYLANNNAYSVLASAITNAQTSITVQAGHGDRFPIIAAPDYTLIALEDTAGNIEIVKVTARASASDVLTVVRAQEGTTAKAFIINSIVSLRPTAALFKNAVNIMDTIHAAPSKTTPVDADEIPLVDSAASYGLAKLTWANLKATLKTYFDALYVSFTSATGSAKLPVGTTAQRDGTPSAGWIRFNSTLNTYEGYLSAAWTTFADTAGLSAIYAQLGGATFTGAINELRATVAATATTTPLWTAANGNVQDWAGTPTITAFPNAPQAGASREIYPATGTIITNAGNISVQGNITRTSAAGEKWLVHAITTTTFYVEIFKKDGKPVIGSKDVGDIFDFAGTTAPAGSLVCPVSQTNISRTTYATLFAVIGTTWGAGDGSTTFGMPWFPANYASVQASANVGTSTVGENLAHTHTYHAADTGGGTVAAGSGLGMPSLYNTGSSGGTANLAAGVRVLKCVSYI